MTYALAIHGGAGALPKDQYKKEDIEEAYRFFEVLLKEGEERLKNGEEAHLIATHLTVLLEDHPLFNAGKGSVFNSAGEVEMDASLMIHNNNGDTYSAGLSGLKTTKNPILGAKALAFKKGHALLSGPGAEEFAQTEKLSQVEPSYFSTEKRWAQHLEFLKTKKVTLDHGQTVGVCVCDSHGNLAAVTSTGGMNGKAPGRVSDSAIIGAGTWAHTKTLALSATGTGDHFIRTALARYVHDLVELKGQSVSEALNLALDLVKETGGQGGFAAVTNKGEVFLPYNSGGMFRASVSSKEKPTVAIWS